MKTIKLKYYIEAPIHDVWDALTNAHTIFSWSGQAAEMSENVGTKFSMWEGDIYGKITASRKEVMLVQDWFMRDWINRSRVTFVLTIKGKGTEIDLTHENIPDADEKLIREGWDLHYLGHIKDYLEKHVI